MTSKVSRTSDAQRGVACAGSHLLADHIPSDTQPALVGEDSSPRAGHGLNDLHNLAEVHVRLAGAGPNVPDHVGFDGYSTESASNPQEPNVGDSISRSSHCLPGTQGRRATASQVIPDSQMANDTHAQVAVGESHVLNGHTMHDAHPGTAVEVPTLQSTNGVSTPISGTSTGAQDSDGHHSHEAQILIAVASTPPGQAMPLSVPIDLTPILADYSNTPTGVAGNTLADQSVPVGLTDPLLALAADVLDDLERVRIANENRLRQLTRDVTDKDGEERGFGLTLDHPDVARLAALVEALVKAEHDATLNLQRMVRKHPLGPWIKAAKGIGEKQGARLLAAIGDPYWNDLHQRPRTVSELWAYCVPTGELVSTPRGSVPIETLKIGDRVYDRYGKPVEIQRVLSRIVDENLIVINAHKMLPLRLTGEHPVLIANFDRPKPLKPWVRKSLTWKKARDVSHGDYLVIPRMPEAPSSGDEPDDELARFWGRFVGDGSTSLSREGKHERGRSTITFGHHEDAAPWVAIAHRIGGVYLGQTGAAQQLVAKTGFTVAGTVSRGLALQLQLLSTRLGSLPSVYLQRPAGFGIIRDRQVVLAPRYNIQWSRLDSQTLSGSSSGGSPKLKYRQDGDYFYVQVSNTEVEQYSGVVYDLSCGGSFLVNNVIVHNCGYHVIRLPSGQYGFGAQVEDATGASTSAHQYHHGTQVQFVGGDLPPVSHPALDTHPKCVDGTGGDPDQACRDTQAIPVGVASVPMRGQRVNWSPTAKMRARLISESIVKAGGPYREVYDAGRAKYAEALHRTPCRRCGPSGKPALIGSALSDGHKHARALRLVSKEILKGLWKEAKRLHELPVSDSSPDGHAHHDTHVSVAVGGSVSPETGARTMADRRLWPPTP